MTHDKVIATCFDALRANYRTITEALRIALGSTESTGQEYDNIESLVMRLGKFAKAIEEAINQSPKSFRSALEASGCIRLVLEWINIIMDTYWMLTRQALVITKGSGLTGHIRLMSECNRLFHVLDVNLDNTSLGLDAIVVEPVADCMFMLTTNDNVIEVLEPPNVIVENGNSLQVRGRGLLLYENRNVRVLVSKGSVILGDLEAIIIDATSYNTVQNPSIYLPAPHGRITLNNVRPQHLVVIAKPRFYLQAPPYYSIAIEGSVVDYKAAVARLDPWDKLSLEPGMASTFEIKSVIDTLRVAVNFSLAQKSYAQRLSTILQRAVNPRTVEKALAVANVHSAFGTLSSITILEIYSNARAEIRVPKGQGIDIAIVAGPYPPLAHKPRLRVEIADEEQECMWRPWNTHPGLQVCSLEGNPRHLVIIEYIEPYPPSPHEAVVTIKKIEKKQYNN